MSRSAGFGRPSCEVVARFLSKLAAVRGLRQSGDDVQDGCEVVKRLMRMLLDVSRHRCHPELLACMWAVPRSVPASSLDHPTSARGYVPYPHRPATCERFTPTCPATATCT